MVICNNGITCFPYGPRFKNHGFIMLYMPVPRVGYERHLHKMMDMEGIKSEYWVYKKGHKFIGPLKFCDQLVWNVFMERWDLIQHDNAPVSCLFLEIKEAIEDLGGFEPWLHQKYKDMCHIDRIREYFGWLNGGVIKYRLGVERSGP